MKTNTRKRKFLSPQVQGGNATRAELRVPFLCQQTSFFLFSFFCGEGGGPDGGGHHQFGVSLSTLLQRRKRPFPGAGGGGTAEEEEEEEEGCVFPQKSHGNESGGRKGRGGEKKNNVFGRPLPARKGGGRERGSGRSSTMSASPSSVYRPPLHLYYYYSDRGRGKSYPRAHRFSKTILNGGKKNRRAFPTPI